MIHLRNFSIRMLNQTIRNNNIKLYEAGFYDNNIHSYPSSFTNLIYENMKIVKHLSLPISESFKNIPYDEQYEPHDFKLNNK